MLSSATKTRSAKQRPTSPEEAEQRRSSRSHSSSSSIVLYRRHQPTVNHFQHFIIGFCHLVRQRKCRTGFATHSTLNIDIAISPLIRLVPWLHLFPLPPYHYFLSISIHIYLFQGSNAEPQFPTIVPAISPVDFIAPKDGG